MIRLLKYYDTHQDKNNTAPDATSFLQNIYCWHAQY